MDIKGIGNVENFHDLKFDSFINGRGFKKMKESLFTDIRNDYGLKQIEIDILYYLYKEGDATVTDITRTLSLNKGHVSLAAGDLCRRGYLEPVINKGDRRYVQLKLTEKSALVTRSIESIKDDIHRKLFNGLNENDISEMIRIIGIISENYRLIYNNSNSLLKESGEKEA